MRRRRVTATRELQHDTSVRKFFALGALVPAMLLATWWVRHPSMTGGVGNRPSLTLFPRQVTRTLFNVFFAMCNKVKITEATKHFRPLLEDGATRKRKLPTSHSCPADLAVSDPQLPLRRETKTRMQTEATSRSHGSSDTPAAEKSKLELELEDADRRPQRDAQQPLENAVPPKSKSKSQGHVHTVSSSTHACAAHACCGCAWSACLFVPLWSRSEPEAPR